ncbi:MAG TPA: tetratricopeptide repeat protein, partial [Gemmatimonadales bacterium]|nr:tetratricopeptide repeat protein [Gemmatimonadales bacterium]
MRRAILGAILFCASLPLRLSAQIQEADGYWAAGDYHNARIAYERVLIADLANVRANLRLGILLSWDNKLDSSLVMIRRARAEDPKDVDLELAEARVLSWAARNDAAVAHYDSVIARAPEQREAWMGKALTLGWAGRYDEADAAYVHWLGIAPGDDEALVGRARLRAWQGDLGGARALYGESLARQPGSASALAGLAQVDRWEGRERAALARADSALRISPNDRDARQLQRELRAALRPQLQFTFGWGLDSDQNKTFWENATASQSIADGVTINGSVGLFQASDPLTTGARTL